MSDETQESIEQHIKNFWENLNDRSDYIKYEFNQASEHLKNYFDEDVEILLTTNTSDSTRKYDITSIAKNQAGLSALTEAMQALHEEAMSDLIDILNGLNGVWNKITQWVSFMWGAIIGDFNKDPTLSQTLIASLISLIPVADQVSDVRDFIANVLTLTDENERANTENWFNLALTAIGIIPLVGSVLKSLVRIIRHKEVKDINTLKQIMETCESYLRRIGVGDKIPWGDDPIAWLQRKPWQGYASEAKNYIQSYLNKFSNELKNGYKNVPSPLQAKMNQLAAQIDDMARQINRYIDEILEQTQSRMDELFGQPNLAATTGGGDVHQIYIMGGNPTRVSNRQLSTKISNKVMPTKRVGCFNRVNTDSARKQAQTNIALDHPAGSKGMSVDDYLDRETDRQLKLQQDALNSMTVEDYEKGRAIFERQGRGSGLDQQQTRDKYRANLLKRYTGEYENNGTPAHEIKRKAESATDDVMTTLAALHNPDQVTGGAASTAPMNMGLNNVNSSIGSQWNNIPKDATINPSDHTRSRVATIDNAVKDLPNKANTHMNIQLKRCT